MIVKGLEPACNLTGFVAEHGRACIEVANHMDCMILFREPGTAAQGLIADSYSMKGFRVDTKSCNWGPMCGFVCVDPRLSKRTSTGGSYAVKNQKWTEEAMSGEINHGFFGDVPHSETAGWKADTLPIVISEARIAELVRKGTISAPTRDGSTGILTGTSSQTFDDIGCITLPWALVPIDYKPFKFNPPVSWLGGEKGKYFVVCKNHLSSTSCALQYPQGTLPMTFRGYETVQGICNPGTRSRGFRACVTADYDIFSVWPSGGWMKFNDRGTHHHNLMTELMERTKSTQLKYMPTGVARMDHVDTRLQAAKHKEHWRYGDVSARVLNVKVMLNTAIQGRGGYKGGNAVHHNDEAGNFALAKGSLAECFPLIVFYPPTRGIYPFFGGNGCVALQNTTDFYETAISANVKYSVVCKPSWQKEIGLML